MNSGRKLRGRTNNEKGYFVLGMPVCFDIRFLQSKQQL